MRDPVLLVDAGGVLLLNDHHLLLPLMSRYGDVRTPGQYQRAHFACHNHVFSGNEEGADRPLDYYEAFGAFAGVPEERHEEFTAQFRRLSLSRNMCRLANPRAVAMLRRVHASGFPVVVVSQADGTAAQLLRDAEVCQAGPGPGVPVEAVVDSHLVGYDKPDPRLFTHALDLLGASPEQAIHLGDTVPADVRGAQAAGIRAVHYDPFEDCADEGPPHDHVRRIGEVHDLLSQMREDLDI